MFRIISLFFAGKWNKVYREKTGATGTLSGRECLKGEKYG